MSKEYDKDDVIRNDGKDNSRLQSENKTNNKSVIKDSSSNIDFDNSNEEIIREIPLYSENFQITKRTQESKVHVEKKWIDSTKKIEVPIKHEEIYINGKEFSTLKENELIEVFSKIKDKISEVFHHEDHHDRNQEKNLKYSEDLDIKMRNGGEIVMEKETEEGKRIFSNEKMIPLISKNNQDNYELQSGSKDPTNDYNNNNNEKVIPLWGEEVVVTKKMVKLGEIVIKKYLVNEKRSIDVEIRDEKLTAKYPNSKVEV